MDLSVVQTLASVVVGAVITTAGGAGAALLVDEVRERRRSRVEIRAERLERLRQTRRMLQALVDQAVAGGSGDAEGAAAAGKLVGAQEQANLHLVGGDDVARAYRDLLVDLCQRFGQAHRVEDQVRILEVMARVNSALDAQADLARAGKPLRMLSPTAIAELTDVRAMADRMPLFDMPPSVDARIARQFMRTLRWFSRRRWKPDPDGR